VVIDHHGGAFWHDMLFEPGQAATQDMQQQQMVKIIKRDQNLQNQSV
jgi:hypothetical protein